MWDRGSKKGDNTLRESEKGGVAERLIAPVLKTGGPKGLVGSNPTSSVALLRGVGIRWQ